MFKTIAVSITLLLFIPSVVQAIEKNTSTEHVTITGMTGINLGTINFENTPYGLLIKPHLTGLQPGLHGFHIHINPSCADNGKAAGGHLDPSHSNQHLGPYNPAGHLGDLPALYVANDGSATEATLAPRLQASDLHNHSIIIHSGGDNYSDQPSQLGGGGSRFACGVIK